MQLKFQKRFPMGAGMLVSYTASKLITDTESQTLWLEPTAGVQDPHNLRAERSLSSQDVPQRLVASGNLDLSYGHAKRFLGSASGVRGKWCPAGYSTDSTRRRKGLRCFFRRPPISPGTWRAWDPPSAQTARA